jgi:hypothetical protein
MYSPSDPQACRAGFRLVRAAMDGVVFDHGRAVEMRGLGLLVLGMLTFKCWLLPRRKD